MYSFKPELLEEVKSKYKITGLAKAVGISGVTLSQILNGHRACPKPTAFCIAKMLNSDAEITDYFNINK